MACLRPDEKRVIYAHNVIMKYCREHWNIVGDCSGCPLQHADEYDLCYFIHRSYPRDWDELFIDE